MATKGDGSRTYKGDGSRTYNEARVSCEKTPLLSLTANQSSPSLNTTINEGDLHVSRVYHPIAHSDVSPPAQMPPSTRSAIRVVLITVVLQSVGFTLVLPSMYLYLQKLGGVQSFYGWVVAIYSVGSFLGSMFFGWWYDHRPAKEVILVSTMIAIGGNLLYPVVEFLPYATWFLFIARFFVGVGSGGVAVCRAYCSEVTDLKNKVAMMAAVSGAQGIGFVIGPGIGSVLSLFSFKVGIFDVTPNTSPGYLSAIFCIFNFFLVLFFLNGTGKRGTVHSKVQSDESLLPIFVGLFLFFSAVSVFAIFETDFTIISQRDFGWGAKQNSIYFLVAAIFSTITYAAIATPRIRKMSEKKAAAFGLLLLIFGMLAFIVYKKPVHIEDKLSFAQLAVGGGLFSVGYPVTSTFVFGLYSKMLNPKVQGQKMGWITAAGSLARMLGPIWASTALKLGDTILFGGTALFLVVAMFVLFACQRLLVPHRDHGKVPEGGA